MLYVWCPNKQGDWVTIHEENDLIETLEEVESAKKKLRQGKHTCLVMRWSIQVLTKFVQCHNKTIMRHLPIDYGMSAALLQQCSAKRPQHSYRTLVSKIIKYLSFLF